MKHAYLLLCLALCATSNSHAAAKTKHAVAKPENELSIEEIDSLQNQASGAACIGDFPTFEAIIHRYPDVINRQYADCPGSTILRDTLSYHVKNEDRSVYIKTLLEQGAILSKENLETCLEYVCCSICLSHEEHIFTRRLKALTSFYSLIASAPLQQDLVRDAIKTPQQWIRNYAKNFLEGKTCTDCNKPWAEHRPINPDYTVRLREALELP